MMSAVTAIPGTNYLQGHLVVRGRSNLISRAIFKKGGLREFLTSVRDPNSPIFISSGVEASTACALLAGQIGLACHNHNQERIDRELKPIPYGVKIWVGGALGLYLTIGTQNLEEFFERNRN